MSVKLISAQARAASMLSNRILCGPLAVPEVSNLNRLEFIFILVQGVSLVDWHLGEP